MQMARTKLFRKLQQNSALKKPQTPEMLATFFYFNNEFLQIFLSVSVSLRHVLTIHDLSDKM